MNHSDRSLSTPLTEAPSKSVTAKTNQRGSKSPFLVFLESLASLKLTVVLLATSVFVIWVATLQQAEWDIWKVKQLHFPSLLVYVPFYTYCPPAWLPEWRTSLTQAQWIIPEFQYYWGLPVGVSWVQRPVGLPIPSGFLVLMAMLVNLTAAHGLRFRIQAKGSRLQTGLIVTLIGIAVCTGVVLVGQSNGLQNQPPIPYSTMWTVSLVAMFGCGLAGAWVAAQTPAHRMIERVMAGSVGLLFLCLPFVLWYSGASIGDSGMRILWQIAQCSAAAAVLLGGLSLLFRRKAGIVLLHAGLILLMGNEIWVTLTHLEQRISGAEGETISHTIDIRETELVLVNREGDKDQIHTIPSAWLEASAQRFQKNPDASWMAIPGTELDVRCLAFYPNSEGAMATGENLANQGIGQRVMAMPIPVGNGVQGNDMPDTVSAYVEFRDAGDKPLGTYLASQLQSSKAPIFQTPNVLDTGDHKYAVSLWFKRFYKPYSVTFNSIESMDYPGTEIPRWYSSEFQIVDRETNYTGTQKVWMNNPLRYRNETFYQSGYYREPGTGKEITTLQVVRNRGWMIPYLCCAMVSLGLLAQFMPVMLGYIEKRERERQQQRNLVGNTPSMLDGLTQPSTAPGWTIPVIAAIVIGLLVVGRGYPKSPVHNELNLKALAKMPISYKGRIQPLDSLARTILRKTMGVEVARSSETSFFGEKKYPAIAWLADSVFLQDSPVEYRVFRIENPSLQQNLSLAGRTGQRYSAEELQPVISKLQVLDNEARRKPKEERNDLDKAALELAHKVAETQTIFNALGGPNSFVRDELKDRPERLYEQIIGASATQEMNDLPGVVPGTEPMAPWLKLDVARARLTLQKIAQETGSEDSTILLMHVVNRSMAQIILEDATLKTEFKELLENKTYDQQVAEIGDRLGSLPFDQTKIFIQRLLNLRSEEGVSQFVAAVLSAIQSLGNETSLESLTDDQIAVTETWAQIQTAYRNQNQDQLDQAVTRYQTILEQQSNVEIPWNKVTTEYSLSGWAPFYLASVLSLVAMVISIPSLLGLQYLQRTAFLTQCLVFLLVTVGLIARIYISGRAPVTSIYSSALGIGWGCVLGFLILEAATRSGIGNVLGGLAGYLMLLVAYGLSLSDDKFSVLRAVLDTQFWLWTHVTCVALGYVLTLLAGLWSLVILAYSFTSRKEMVKRSAELTYGLICAATILSFVGTVLGGLWADDSWGRFWGWDPKENGAAMIVLWNAAVLHARWAGMIRYRGLIAMALVGNIITLWSWFGVNELGIGIHSYGFTQGVIFYLSLAWVLHLAAIAFTIMPFVKLDPSSVRAAT